MDNRKILEAIDEQIARLQQAKELLGDKVRNGSANTRVVKRGGGRRKLSASARANIVAAQKARWAKWKKAKKSA